MTEAINKLLEEFDALPFAEKDVALAELLRRHSPQGDLPFESLHAVADELFHALDAEEAARAGR